MNCNIQDCNNYSEARTSYPSKEQRSYLKAREHTYYICDECEDKGWKYNTVRDEYYLRPTKVVRINLLTKKRIKR